MANRMANRMAKSVLQSMKQKFFMKKFAHTNKCYYLCACNGRKVPS